MKKMYSLLRWPCLLQDVLNERLLFKNKPAAVAPKKPSPSFLRFWNWAKKTVEVHAVVAAQKMLLKQKPSKHS